LQQQFLQFEKAITAATDGLSVDMVEFRQVFAPPTLPDRNANYSAAANAIAAVVNMLIGLAAAAAKSCTIGGAPTLGTIKATGLGALTSGVVSGVSSWIMDNHTDDQISFTDFSILTY
jgi:hypothetical protein